MNDDDEWWLDCPYHFLNWLVDHGLWKNMPGGPWSQDPCHDDTPGYAAGYDNGYILAGVKLE